MKIALALAVTAVILTVAGCDTDTHRAHHMSAEVAPPPASPPPPPNSNMRPYVPEDYQASDRPTPPAEYTGAARNHPPRMKTRPASIGPHPIVCNVTDVNTKDAKFGCSEHHASWTFHVSLRSDILGELKKGQRVRVLSTVHHGVRSAEDVKILP